MKEVSFIIPIRVDSYDRIENFEAVLKYINIFFGDSEIIVIEDDKDTRIEKQLELYPQIVYVHLKNDGRFSKSRAVNAGLLKATREFVIIHDADVLVNPDSINLCLKKMKRGIKHIMVPYNSVVINVAGQSKQDIIEGYDFTKIQFVRTGLEKPQNNEHSYSIHTAGICIIRLSLLLNLGGFNKKMISYGYEDVEIYARLKTLGFYRFMTAGYNLIHLDHHRGSDSMINELYLENRKEYNKVTKMPYRVLWEYATNDLKIKEIDYSDISHLVRKQRMINIFLLQTPIFFIKTIISYLTHNRWREIILKVFNSKLRRRNQYLQKTQA